MKKLLSEPLLHFLLIGGLLFFIYDLKNDEIIADDSNSIVITEANIDQLINQWQRRWQRLPSQQELQGLVKAQIHEEVLYREALAMGLDKDDAVVRQRMARKIEFISNDLASLAEPTDSQLQAYLDTHAETFTLPGQISFSQVYFNADKRGEQAQADADHLLAELSQSTTDVDISSLGDAFMGGQVYDSLNDFEVSRLFGDLFSEQLFELATTKWVGPVESGYGLHLVRIDSRTDPRAPSLARARDKVQNEWLAEQQRKANTAFFAELHKRYKITVELPTSTPPKTGTNEKS